MSLHSLLINLVLAAYCVGHLIRCKRKGRPSFVLNIAGLLGLCLIMGLTVSPETFSVILWLSWGGFLYVPVLLMGPWFVTSKLRRRNKIVTLCLTLAIVIVGTDAFLIEPYHLKVTHLTLSSNKLDQPLRIAILADIQTDSPGSYEAKVLARVKQASPDLILFLGDYIQAPFDQFSAAAKALNQIIKQADLSAPLGMYAIQGNWEHTAWTQVFDQTAVQLIEDTTTLDLGPLTLTGLSFPDSTHPYDLPTESAYHIAMGHCPDFALGQTHADLMLAGHTHGGQVCLPGIGPLLFFSQVPRTWASGLTEVTPNQYLYVSRGIGMEHGSAPRMRFLCPPELVILTLTPKP